MFPFLILGLVGIGAWALLHGKHAQTTTLPVMFGDNVTVAPGQFAVWHSTPDQTQRFGPRYPEYWNLNGYFMYRNTSGGWDTYKPTWQVAVQGPQA